MDMHPIAQLITWATFVVAATIFTHKLGLSDAKFSRKTALYFGAGVLFTILFGVNRGLAFFVLCPLLLVFYSKKKGDVSNSSNSTNTLHAIESVQSEKEKFLFSELYEGITTHIYLVTTLCEEKMRKLSGEQIRKFFAFELGSIEWYGQAIMRIGESSDDNSGAYARFFNFLIYYANKKYEERGDDIISHLQRACVWRPHARSAEIGL